MSDGPRIIRMLDLSTAHLPEHLGSELSPRNLLTCDGVTAASLPYGFLLWVPEDPAKHAADYPGQDGVPSEVVAIQLRARGLGCDYVLLDADADVDSALPTWDW